MISEVNTINSSPQQEDILFVGRSVTQAGDPLMPVPLDKVMARIRQPRQDIQDLILQLRALRSR